MIRPLVSYYGGKQRIASKIVEEINQIPHTFYAEPYAGGAAVLFAKPRKYVTASERYKEAINDISNELITLYRVAVERPDELALKLEATLFSQEEHRRSREILKNSAQHDDLIVAWAYFVQANCSFSHGIGKGWGVGVLSQNMAHTWMSRILRLREQLDRLQGVHIACEDALTFISRFDSAATLFYVDCPYVDTDCGHYGGWTEDDWIALCDKLDTIEGSFILSNYPHDYAPKTTQIRKEIKAVMSAKGQTGKARREAEAIEREAAERIEVLWIKVNGRSKRRDVDKMLAADQLSLLI